MGIYSHVQRVVMKLRCIEFLKIESQYFFLDIVEVFYDEGSQYFHIHVSGEMRFQFIMAREVDEDWKIITQDFPDFILSTLFGPLVTLLENRLKLETAFLAVN